MNKGGQVLLDNYKIIHGLNVFSKPRMCGATYPGVKDGKVCNTHIESGFLL